jgi:cobyrinic acid a,c-diamide synthase
VTTAGHDVPVLLLAHGTRDDAGRAELRELRLAVQRQRSGGVRIGVIEYPDGELWPAFAALADAAGEARRRALDEVRVVPLLLFPAGHAQEDLRTVIRGGRLLHPDLRLRCVPLLRPSPALLDAATARLRAAEAQAGSAADAVLVVGRGSTCAHANARLARLVGAALERRTGLPVAHAFASLAPPTVSDAVRALAAAGAAHVVVLPYLLTDGRIARRIGVAARDAGRRCGTRLSVAAHLGLHPAVVAYVRARADGIRGIELPAAPSHGTAQPADRSRVVFTRSTHRRPIVIAGTASGSGKTTVTLGLLAALRARGLRVQPFKAGPDYIDPLHHTAVAGRVSRNLDGVLCDPRALPALARRAMAGADVAVVEGVLGLFDGRLPGAGGPRRGESGDAGSTAEVARLLDAAVLLVVDAARSARSTAAVALGFARFDPRVRIAGVILNRVGSDRHLAAARGAIEEATEIPVLGALPLDPELTLPDRYLGLVPPQERPHPPQWAASLAAATSRHVDLEAVLRLAAGDGPHALPGHDPFAIAPCPPRARVAVARDAAFSFQYQDSLDLLAAWGAELIPFSPLGDTMLPAGCGAILLGGGFPERFAGRLAANTAMRTAIAAAARRGVAVIGECGGAMYLSRAITTEDGQRHPMCGLLPWGAAMDRTRRALGYRTVTALRDSPLLRAGATVIGHEFHWSSADGPLQPDGAAYRVAETANAPEGHASRTLLASYVHLHLCGVPEAARRLVDAAAQVASPSAAVLSG